MLKYRCPRFGCNGIGLPAGTKRPLSRSSAVIGITSAYLAGGSNSNMFLTAFGYRGRRVITFECQKCGRT
ncbi:MAG: hypothetical protein K6E98_06995 [Lachnospiraceae bacterium]|nr:hypothetical protein [Lachnospiraceae bacterium]